MTPSSSSESLSAAEPAPKRGLWKRIRSAPDLVVLEDPSTTAQRDHRLQRQPSAILKSMRHLDAAIKYLQPHPARSRDECGQRSELLELKSRIYDD